MKEYTNKTVDEAVADACKELGIPAEQLVYKVTEEKKGLFSKKATIAVYDVNDAVEFAQEYLKTAVGGMGITITTTGSVEEDIIHITIDSERNPVLIGKNGRTLQALNELDRLAVSNKFRHRYRILLDVGGYKEDKYSRIAYLAKRTANEVLKSHIDVHLDPMTPDERRVVHNTLSGMAHIKTESSGEGMNRAVTVKYIPGPGESKPTSVASKPVEEKKPVEAEKPVEVAPVAPEVPAEEVKPVEAAPAETPVAAPADKKEGE
jgi:spoIIIJ-associated protein